MISGPALTLRHVHAFLVLQGEALEHKHSHWNQM